MKLNLYIHSTVAIQPEPVAEPVTKLLCNEPDFAGAIPPMQLRRMSKAVRMGLLASLGCLADAAVDMPDAIIIGTGFGCVQDTGVFLTKMIEQEEQLLTPTAFIQSTHNTVAGQIALNRGCTGYNLTVSQGGHSFEGALVAAQLYLSENPGSNVLLGAVDELTPTSHRLLQRAGAYTMAPQSPGRGAIGGEGAAAFFVRDEAAGALCRITGVYTDRVLPGILNGSATPDILLLGDSGEAQTQDAYEQLRKALPSIRVHYFKEWSGDFPTASAVGLSMAIKGGKGRFTIVNHWCDSWSALSGEVL